MNIWKGFTLISAAAAALVGCGLHIPGVKAENKSTSMESPASRAAPVQAAAEEIPAYRDTKAEQREIVNLQAQRATENYQQSRIAEERATIALNEITADLRAAQWHREQEESALLQARDRELDASLRLNRNTQLGRLGAVAESLVAESDDAMQSAGDLVSTIQSALDSCSREITLLESQQRQAFAALQEARQRVSETESARAAAAAQQAASDSTAGSGSE